MPRLVIEQHFKSTTVKVSVLRNETFRVSSLNSTTIANSAAISLT
jgi:hypothetical protein